MARIIGAVSLLSMLDLALTVTLMHTTGMYESNPVAVAIVRHGTLALAAFKLGSISVTSAILWLNRRTRLGRIGGRLCVVTLAALTMHWAHVMNTVVSGEAEWAQEQSGQDARWVCMNGAAR